MIGPDIVLRYTFSSTVLIIAPKPYALSFSTNVLYIFIITSVEFESSVQAIFIVGWNVKFTTASSIGNLVSSQTN